ncbi:MAG: hypothetical protein OXU85_00995 [Thaumarchaeota archaeon]|nr:hypothetical protein [Nitrososphaerota archaeon]
MPTETRTGQGILRLPVARGGDGEGERRRASDEAAFLRGEALVLVYDAGAEAAARDRDNRGRRGGQLTVSWAMIAALAVIREMKRVAYRELHGCLRKRTGGRCTVPCPQLCRRTGSPGIESFRGGMAAGGFEVSLRRRDGGMEVRVRRARRRAERGMTIERRGGMAAVCAGPGRMPEPGAVVDATFLSTGNRSAGRPGKWGHEAGRRDNHRPSACSGTRTNRTVVAVPADDRTGDGAGADRRGAGGVWVAARQGRQGPDDLRRRRARLAPRLWGGAQRRVPPVRADQGDRLRPLQRDGGVGRGVRVAARRDPRPARRANLDGLTAEEKSAHREDWKAEVGYSTRSRSEYVFSSFKRTLGGHVAARKWENVVMEVARKVAIHNAVLEAARGARRAGGAGGEAG